jgi:hypothetical protein
MIKKSLLLIIILILTAACSQNRTLEDAVSARYQVGDEWTYLTRPGEPLSTFLVTKIDTSTVDGEEQIFIHIAITDLAIDHPEGGQVTAVPHMPFTEAALNRSALQPFNVIDPIPPEYLNAYQNWRTRYETGDAVVFDVTIAHALDNLQATIQSTTPSP